MSYENFQHSRPADTTKHHDTLNLCDLFEAGKQAFNHGQQTLTHDLTTYGPGMVKSALKTPPETALLAGASLGLVAVGAAASSEALIGLAGVTGICLELKLAGDAAKNALHEQFPKYTF